MEIIEQKVIEGLRDLPPHRQAEVLDFVEFLKHKLPAHADRGQGLNDSVSAMVAAGDLIGSIDGPEDLSTNPTYMEGFGQS